jgi:hypothetical protein
MGAEGGEVTPGSSANYPYKINEELPVIQAQFAVTKLIALAVTGRC